MLQGFGTEHKGWGKETETKVKEREGYKGKKRNRKKGGKGRGKDVEKKKKRLVEPLTPLCMSLALLATPMMSRYYCYFVFECKVL